MANYYFDSINGNDSWSGTTEYPYKSLTKLNSIFSTVPDGTTIYLKRGSIWSGSGTTINISQSGSAGLPITIGAYGTGNKPILSGFFTVTGWTNEGGGIYSKIIPCETTPNLITIDGVLYRMGRYPNIGTDLIYESHTGNTKISSTSLNSSITNWTGAEAVIRKKEFILDRCIITDHTGQTLTYINIGTTQEPEGDDRYFFIQNDLRTLTEFGEWYYNSGITKMYVYFGAENPVNYEIKVPTIGKLVMNVGGSKDYINITDISFEGTSIGETSEGGGVESGAIFFENGNCDHINITNCDFRFCGSNAITLQSSYSLIDNNTFTDIMRQGAEALHSFMTVTNNTFLNIGVIEGATFTASRAPAIWAWGDDTLIQYNHIDNVAKVAIMFSHNRTVVKNNYITNWATTMNDAGAIYTDGSTTGYTGRVIEGNIMYHSNCKKGKESYGNLVPGIYMDSYADDILVKDNTIIHDGHDGIMISNGSNINVQNNTTFGPVRGIYFLEWSAGNTITGITMNYNNFIAKNSTDATLQFQSNYGTIGSGITSNYNYFARPINEGASIQTFESPLDSNTWQNRTLANWQSYTGQDLNSSASPYTISTINQVDVVFNSGKTELTIPLAGNYKNLNGDTFNGSITLLPFTSEVLFVVSINKTFITKSGKIVIRNGKLISK